MVEGPVLIRIVSSSPGYRETCDKRFLAAAWSRHPLLLTSVDFVGLETETDSILLAYIGPSDATTRLHPLGALTAERNLHMDMLREAGRRADAHLARYTWALGFIRPNDELIDAACGLGYGSAILVAGSACRHVRGLDVSEWAVAYALDVYAPSWPNLAFEVRDLQNLSGIGSNSVDCVISFETLEHLADPRAFTAEVLRVLKPGGRFLCSVPNYWADESGRDPSPYHLQTFDLLLLLDVCHSFRIDSVVGQCAGGGNPRFRPIRALETFETPPDPADPRGRLIEWWLLAAVKDPVGADNVPYKETAFLSLERQPTRLPFSNGYHNPWLVHSLVHQPFRLRSRDALIRAANEVRSQTQPGTADHGAALAVLAYQLLSRSSSAHSRKFQEIRAAIENHLEVVPNAPHEHRWYISLSFVQAQLLLAEGRLGDARRQFEHCASLDFRRFAPHIATKTTEAAFQAGRLALHQGQTGEAARNFNRGIAIGRQLTAVPLDDILIDPQRPNRHGLGDGMRELVLALDSVSRCANGLNLIDRYQELHRADILTIDYSWQWEVLRLHQDVSEMAAHAAERQNQVQLLTKQLQECHQQLAALAQELEDLNALSRDGVATKERQLLDARREVERTNSEARKVLDEKEARLLSAVRDAEARLEQVQTLTAMLRATEEDNRLLHAQLKQLTDRTHVVEAESSDRFDQIEKLTVIAQTAERDNRSLRVQIDELTARIRAIEPESQARWEQIQELTALAKAAQEESLARFRQIEKLTSMLHERSGQGEIH